MIAASVYSVLTGDVTLASLIGTRAYSSVAPERCSRPYVVFRLLSTVADSTLDGHDGLMDALIQVDCMAASQDGARSVADATRAALADYSGTIGGHETLRFRFEGEADNWELEMDGGEDIIGRVTQTWGVWYCESHI